MAHALGATHKLPHGLANAMLLLQNIRYNWQEEAFGQETGKQYVAFGCAMFFRTSPLCEAKGIEEKLKQLEVFLGVPGSIKEWGISEEEFIKSIPDMVKNAMADFTTRSKPRTPKPEDLVRLYLESYYGI